MSPDRSLEEFIDAEPAEEPADGETSEPSTDAESGDGTTEDEGVNEDDAETTPDTATEATDAAPNRPTVTYGFEPDGVCERCGESTPTRYRDDGTWVCGGCKDW